MSTDEVSVHVVKMWPHERWPGDTGGILHVKTVVAFLRDPPLPAAYVVVHFADADKLDRALAAGGVEVHKDAVAFNYQRKM